MTRPSIYGRPQAALALLALLLVTPAHAQLAKPSAVPAGTYALDKDHAKLNWAVSHFGFSTYTGEFTKLDAKLTLDPARPQLSSLVVTVDTATVQTNSDKLDAHLRSDDFFDTSKFPVATFRSTRLEPMGMNKARVTGDLTLRGVTKPVTLVVTFNGAGVNPATRTYTVGFSAEGTISRSQFGVAAFSPAIGEEVALTISGEFNPVAPAGSQGTSGASGSR